MQSDDELEFELLLEDPYLSKKRPQEDREESVEGKDLSKKSIPDSHFQKSIPQEDSGGKSISKETRPEKKKSIPQDDREESVESKEFSAQTVFEKSIPQEHCDDSIPEEANTVVEGKDLSERQIENTTKESLPKEKENESSGKIKDASIETPSRKSSKRSNSEKKESLSTPASVLRRPREAGKSPNRSVRFDKTAEKESLRRGPNNTQKHAFRRLLIARRGKRVIQKVKQREEKLNDLENQIQSDSDSSYDCTSSEEESDSESSSSYSENATKSSSEIPAATGVGAESEVYKVGDTVWLINLDKDADLNNEECIVAARANENWKLTVRVKSTGELILARLANISRIRPDEFENFQLGDTVWLINLSRDAALNHEECIVTYKPIQNQSKLTVRVLKTQELVVVSISNLSRAWPTLIEGGKDAHSSKRRLPEGPKRLEPTDIPLLTKPKNCEDRPTRRLPEYPKKKVMPFGMLEDNLDIPMKKKQKKRRPRRGIRRRVPDNSTPDKKVSRAPVLVPPPARKKLEIPNVVAPRTRNHRQGLVDIGSPDFSESQDMKDEEESESLSVGGDMMFYCDDYPPSTLDEIQERLEEIMKEEKTKEPEVRKQQKTKKYNTYRSVTPSVTKRMWKSNLKKSHSRANSEPTISIREDVFNLLPSESAVFGFAFQNLLHKDESLQTSI